MTMERYLILEKINEGPDSVTMWNKYMEFETTSYYIGFGWGILVAAVAITLIICLNK